MHGQFDKIQYPWLEQRQVCDPPSWLTAGVWMPRKRIDTTPKPRTDQQPVTSSINQNFVYLDVGCWCDNALGRGERRRNFGLVCGPHIFLCEFSRDRTASAIPVDKVQRFFQEMSIQGCGINVVQYLYADTTRRMTDTSKLFLFLGDLHLPPVSWFHEPDETSTVQQIYDPPDWLASLMAAHPETEQLMRNRYSLAELFRQSNNYHPAHGPLFGGYPDIFGQAGDDLVFFLNALCNIDSSVKQSLNFIQVGDMFELMLSEDYQFQPSSDGPTWKHQRSPIRVYDWALEIIIQNVPVIEAFRRLGRTGLAQCRYVWGNHDCYLSDGNIARGLGLPNRVPYFTDLDGKLFCEHGQRFDEFTFDNRDSGNAKMNVSYFIPTARQYETTLRKAAGQDERQCYLDGAEQTYRQNKIALYVMAHTHISDLSRCDVSEEATL